MARKDHFEFIKLIKESVTVNPETGILDFHDKIYAQMSLNITFKGNALRIPYSHIVWLLTHDRWPKEGMHIDHINDNPQDNRPCNLQELTHEDSQKKRRGRKVYRSYGTGKYGYGINIHYDKRDNRFYISRHFSRGHGNGELKTRKIALGGFNTLEEAEAKVSSYINEIKEKGLDYVSDAPPKNEKQTTQKLNDMTEVFRDLRQQGHTLDEIKEITGVKSGIYDRVKDIKVDGRSRSKGEGNGSAKLTIDKVLEIRKLRTEGKSLSQLAIMFGITKQTIAAIIQRRTWTHI